MANKVIPRFLKNLKGKIKDRFYPNESIEVKKEIIIVDPRRNTRSLRTQNLKYFETRFSPRELKRWYTTREVMI